MRWLISFQISTLLLLCGCPVVTQVMVDGKIGGETVDDADGDGFTVAQGDCDDDDALVYPEYWYEDADGDGYGDPLARERLCAPGSGYALNAEDCDDNDAGVNPGVEETWYDGVDSDCDGESDNDADGDGHEAREQGGTDCDDTDAASTTVSNDFDCDGSPTALDCNDADESIYPGAPETWYDDVDSDCAEDSDFDADGDGEDSDQHGGVDCDDEDASIHTGAVETWYDGVDSDCAGDSDNDADGDGADSDVHGGTDCDDSDAALNQIDLDNDGDTTCDGDCDDNDDTQHLNDNDSDGFSPCGGDCDDSDASLTPLDVDQDGWTSCNGDCNDLSPSTFPGAAQIEAPTLICMSDADDDGYGSDSPLSGVTAGTDCDDTDANLVPLDVDGDTYSTCTGDCDETSISVNPGATETWYDGVDTDCSGGSDYDADSDGDDSDAHGGTDCDDTNAAVNPAAAEDYATTVDENCVNDAPVVDSVTLSPTSVTTDTTVTANVVASDPEGDSVSLTYAWFVAGSVVAETGASLSGTTYFDEDQEVYVQVTPSDGSLSGAPVASTASLVDNSPPTAPVISLTPSSPTTDDNLVCSVDTESTDADGHSLSYAYEWTVGASSFNGASDAVDYLSSTVSFSDTSEGENWTCDVNADDGYAVGPTVSASVTLAGGGSGVCSSLEFDGNDVITLDGGVPAALAGSNTTKMVAAWIWRDSNASGYEVATLGTSGSSCGNTSCGGERLMMYATTDHMGIDIGQGMYELGSALPMNEWVYIFAGYDSGTGGYFLGFVHDGALTIENPGTVNGISRSVISQGNQILLGKGEHNQFFEGLVDRVEIWDTRPSDADLLAWAQEDIDPNRAGLYAAWNLDEQSGSTVTDEVSGWSGTISGAAWSSECALATGAGGCADGNLELGNSHWGRSDIAFCQTSDNALPSSTSAADALCGTGWQLCTAAEYMDRNDACRGDVIFSGVIDDGENCMVHDDGNASTNDGSGQGDTHSCDQDFAREQYAGSCTAPQQDDYSAHSMTQYSNLSSGPTTLQGALCCQQTSSGNGTLCGGTDANAWADFETGASCPVAYWDMETLDSNGDVVDAISGNNLEPYGSPSPITDGAHGGAYHLAGVYQDQSASSYFVSQSAFPAQLAGLTPKTLSVWAWVASHSTAFTGNVVASFGGTAGHGAFGLQEHQGAPYFVGFHIAADVPGSASWTEGAWHHLVATFDGTDLRLYMDGALDVSAARALSTGTGFPYFTVGADSWFSTTTNFMMDGSVDEFKVYDYALSDAEVAALYDLHGPSFSDDSICAGVGYYCTLDAVGAITCVGDDTYNLIADTPTDSGYTALADGKSFACALDAAGSITCWGRDHYQQATNVLAGSGYTRLELGRAFGCALDTAGSISCWGWDQSGTVSAAPGGTGFESMSCGEYHCCALDTQGAMSCWGDNSNNRATAVTCSPACQELAAGQAHNCVLDTNGAVTCWGRNEFGQTNAPSGTYSRVYSFTAGATNCAADSAGLLTCWGYDSHGEVNAAPTTLTGVGLAGGQHFGCELFSDGSVSCWGDVPCSDGSSSACAATSCKNILNNGGSTGDGTYWIDPDGSGAFEAYCDMTTDGGGWTLVVGIHADNTSHVSTAAVTSSNLTQATSLWDTGKGKFSDAVIQSLVTEAYRLNTDTPTKSYWKHDPQQPFEASLNSHPLLEIKPTWQASWESGQQYGDHRVLDTYGPMNSGGWTCPASFTSGCAVYTSVGGSGSFTGAANGGNWVHHGALWAR